MAQGKGNIAIFDDTVGTLIGSSPEYKEWVFTGNDAALMNHFHQKDLTTIAQNYSGLISREPQSGPTNSITIRSLSTKAPAAKRIIEKMVYQIERYPHKDVDYKQGNQSKVADYLRKHEESEYLYMPDIVKCKIQIFGRTYDDVGKADHQLKVYLGELKPTSTKRLNRQISAPGRDSATSNSSAEVSKARSGIFTDDASYSVSGMSSGYKSTNSETNARSGSYSHSARNASVSHGSSSGNDFSYEITLKNGFVLKVYKASITHVDVDAIVNAANDNMMHGGGVARVISEAAGWELDNESSDYVKQYGNLDVAENIVTTAGRLRHYKGVIHAVGPMWYTYREKTKCLDDLSDCVYNMLQTCQKEGFRTVAMSAISAGIFAVPKELCADMYVDAAVRFSSSLTSTADPRELHIVDIDTSILKLIEVSVKKWQTDSQSINARIALPKFLADNPHLAGQTTSNYERGHRAQGHRSYGGQRHGGGDQAYGRDGDGIHGTSERHNQQSSDDLDMNTLSLEIACPVKKLHEETFHWGGVANCFLVDKQITVKIYRGEIDKVRNMDAIICGTDKYLTSRGFIADALTKAGGDIYQKTYQNMRKKHNYKGNDSDVFKCEGGRLGTRYVFHAVTVRVVNADDGEIEAYRKCMEGILKKAKNNHLKRLAIPLLGTGNIQTNTRKLKLCGAALLNALDAYLVKNSYKTEITEIHLVNNKTEVREALVAVFNEAANHHGNPGRNSQGSSGCHGNRSSSGTSGGQGHSGTSRDKYDHRSSQGEKSFTAHNHGHSSDGYTGRKSDFSNSRRSGRDATERGSHGNDNYNSQSSNEYDAVGSVHDVDDNQPMPTKKPDSPKPSGNLVIIEN